MHNTLVHALQGPGPKARTQKERWPRPDPQRSKKPFCFIVLPIELPIGLPIELPIVLPIVLPILLVSARFARAWGGGEGGGWGGTGMRVGGGVGKWFFFKLTYWLCMMLHNNILNILSLFRSF